MPSLPSLPPIFSILPLLSSACPGISPPNFARAARDAFPFPFPESQAPILEDVLFKIQSVPDDVLDRGKPAVVQWTVENTDLGSVERDLRDLEKRQAWVAVVKWFVFSLSLQLFISLPSLSRDLVSYVFPTSFSFDPSFIRNTPKNIYCAIASPQYLSRNLPNNPHPAVPSKSPKSSPRNGFPLAKLRRVKELIKALGGANAVAKMLLKAKTLREFFIIGGVELAELGQMLLGLQGVVGACFSWV